MTTSGEIIADRYQIIEILGQGGIGIVFKALDTRLDQTVAVKMINWENITPSLRQEIRARFDREAREMARLSHPHIVPVLDYGEHAGVPFFVMKWMPGGSLKDRLEQQKKSLPWQKAVELVRLLAGALAYAHKAGIIHRDIKPSNILLTEDGDPMLADFGIAKIVRGENTTDLTGTGTGIGTPEYMAPEQGMGQQVDERTDVYSLGIVLYELVTGRKPFKADTPLAVLLKQVNDPLSGPRNFVPDLPTGVEKVILKALEKKPADRYRDMPEFSHVLRGLDKPDASPPSERWRRSMIWLGVGAVIGIIIIASFFPRGDMPTQPAGSNTLSAPTLQPARSTITPTQRPSPTKTSTTTRAPTRTQTQTELPSSQITFTLTATKPVSLRTTPTPRREDMIFNLVVTNNSDAAIWIDIKYVLGRENIISKRLLSGAQTTINLFGGNYIVAFSATTGRYQDDKEVRISLGEWTGSNYYYLSYP